MILVKNEQESTADLTPIENTSHFRIPFSGHLRPIKNRKILEKEKGRGDVLPPFPQGRHGIEKHIEPVVEAFSEPAGSDFLTKVLVGRGDEAEIGV